MRSLGGIAVNILSTYGARLIGVAVGWGSARLIAKGINVDPEVSRAVTDLGAAMLGSYVLSHRTTSKALNPGDAASGHIALEERELKRELIDAAKGAAVGAVASRVAPLHYPGINPHPDEVGEPDQDPNAAGGPGLL